MEKFFQIFAIMLATALLQACSGVMPVPGGKDTVNNNFYQSSEDLKSRLGGLKTGMTEDLVFSTLERSREELVKLDRQQILIALNGGPYMQGFTNPATENISIKSLSGYLLNYRIVKRHHGLKSPISLRTNEKGFDYSAVLVFKDGILFEEPIVSGGLIDRSSSKTVFDYLNPGTVMKRVGI